MTKFFRMEFKGACEPPAASGEFRVIPYSRDPHHEEIPLIYANSFKEKAWGKDWDNISEFDPKGVFLAEAGESGELIGYVVSFKRKDFGYISVVAVKTDWRKRGVASALIKTAVAYLHSLSLKTVKIDVEEKRVPAIELYKKIGFSVVETLED